MQIDWRDHGAGLPHSCSLIGPKAERSRSRKRELEQEGKDQEVVGTRGKGIEWIRKE